MENKGPKEIIINPDKGPSLEELRQEVIKEWKKSRIGISSTLTPKQWEELFDNREVNKKEVTNIFNELLEWWYQSEEIHIQNRFIDMDKDIEKLKSDKADYIKRFKEAFGVE